ncbi:SigE family RNA polymerase sigma factor [Nocardioides agariphilus]|jgi:RNA polymerase sigma-70 factor (sigma-E family)|uniref:SigE family RNA polymerase sigma factor n=2 Tax=Nocardioides agariphilus TaxID=433664 RepID=A0A930VL44_9ACTN|nr:SigE family RNA polymerase sigma factor [Nocardioides agariphilus]MBF4766853.1 SigE family RNA polymerase sigma factor [Nocardioides agariphilus]
MEVGEEFASYMSARWTGLVRSLVMLGCEAHEAEDVVQTALVRCYSAWDRVSRADDPDAYVYRSVLNVWAKSRRRRWWGERPTKVLPDPGMADGAEAVPVRRDIERALGRLSSEHRAVLVLRFVADLSEAQVAEVLGIPPGTVKSRTARAIARIDLADLREELS